MAGLGLFFFGTPSNNENVDDDYSCVFYIAPSSSRLCESGCICGLREGKYTMGDSKEDGRTWPQVYISVCACMRWKSSFHLARQMEWKWKAELLLFSSFFHASARQSHEQTERESGLVFKYISPKLDQGLRTHKVSLSLPILSLVGWCSRQILTHLERTGEPWSRLLALRQPVPPKNYIVLKWRETREVNPFSQKHFSLSLFSYFFVWVNDEDCASSSGREWELFFPSPLIFFLWEKRGQKIDCVFVRVSEWLLVFFWLGGKKKLIPFGIHSFTLRLACLPWRTCTIVLSWAWIMFFH